jgi:hypothetical protein
MTVSISIQLLNTNAVKVYKSSLKPHIIKDTDSSIITCLWDIMISIELAYCKLPASASFSIEHNDNHIGTFPIEVTQPSRYHHKHILVGINKVLHEHPEWIYLFDFKYRGQIDISNLPLTFMNTFTTIRRYYTELFPLHPTSILPKYQSTLPTHIKRIIYDKLKADNDITCSICLSDMDLDDFIVTKCGHYFHSDCLNNCSASCPICRQSLV